MEKPVLGGVQVMTKFFTIITSTYNAGSTLPRLLESLASQTCRDFELIIQDGASKDNTLDVLQSYASRLPSVSIASAPDSGIYNAWNKAVQRIQGQWVIFLGADDCLVSPDSLETVRQKLLPLPASVVFGAGDVFICDDDNELFLMRGLDGNVAKKLRAGEPAVHSALFQRACLFAGTPFDESFKVVGDYDFVARLWRKDEDGHYLDIPVTRMSIGGATSNLRTMLRYRYEKVRVMNRYYGFEATLPHLPGLVKGLLPYALSRMFSPQRAVFIYNKIRTLRKLKAAYIK